MVESQARFTGICGNSGAWLRYRVDQPAKAPMFVVLSQFVLANAMEEEVCDAFRQRPHLVDSAPGFIRMEVLNPVDEPESFWLLTYWKEERFFREWHRGHQYQESHEGIPKGLKLVPGRNQITLFNHVAS